MILKIMYTMSKRYWLYAFRVIENVIIIYMLIHVNLQTTFLAEL